MTDWVFWKPVPKPRYGFTVTAVGACRCGANGDALFWAPTLKEACRFAVETHGIKYMGGLATLLIQGREENGELVSIFC